MQSIKKKISRIYQSQKSSKSSVFVLKGRGRTAASTSELHSSESLHISAHKDRGRKKKTTFMWKRNVFPFQIQMKTHLLHIVCIILHSLYHCCDLNALILQLTLSLIWARKKKQKTLIFNSKCDAFNLKNLWYWQHKVYSTIFNTNWTVKLILVTTADISVEYYINNVLVEKEALPVNVNIYLP